MRCYFAPEYWKNNRLTYGYDEKGEVSIFAELNDAWIEAKIGEFLSIDAETILDTLYSFYKVKRFSVKQVNYLESVNNMYDYYVNDTKILFLDVPKFIRDFIEKYSTNEDVERINTMNKYFNGLIDTLPNPYVMKTKHRIYSITLNNFINDLLEGKIIATDEPDEDRLKKIFSPYLDLTKLDLVFSGNIDQQFVDFYPQYTDREILPSQRHIIERFVKVFMPANINPTDATVYGD